MQTKDESKEESTTSTSEEKSGDGDSPEEVPVVKGGAEAQKLAGNTKKRLQNI